MAKKRIQTLCIKFGLCFFTSCVQCINLVLQLSCISLGVQSPPTGNRFCNHTTTKPHDNNNKNLNLSFSREKNYTSNPLSHVDQKSQTAISISVPSPSAKSPFKKALRKKIAISGGTCHIHFDLLLEITGQERHERSRR